MREDFDLIDPWAKVSAVLLVTTALAAGLVLWLVSGSEANYVVAYLFTAAAVVPFFWLLYRLDKKGHQACLQCYERIDARAKVCPYCGWRVPKETYRPSGSRSTPPD